MVRSRSMRVIDHRDAGEREGNQAGQATRQEDRAAGACRRRQAGDFLSASHVAQLHF